MHFHVCSKSFISCHGSCWLLNLCVVDANFVFFCSYHAIGLLVLFIQDIGDVALEVSKTILYFKTRNGVEHALPKLLADIGFAFFTIQWYAFIISYVTSID